MLHRQGVTLAEMIVILIIIGIIAAFGFVNFSAPAEQARAKNAQNNLLAIYSAQQNYANNNSSSCPYTVPTGVNASCWCLGDSPASTACTGISAHCAGSLAAINCNLSLNIEDDGTYSYACSAIGGFGCTATRNNATAAPIITVYLNSPIQYPLSKNQNPYCGSAGNTCPY